jgi:hypothetical protein
MDATASPGPVEVSAEASEQMFPPEFDRDEAQNAVNNGISRLDDLAHDYDAELIEHLDLLLFVREKIRDLRVVEDFIQNHVGKVMNEHQITVVGI